MSNDNLVLIHRIAGYITVFLIAPLALYAFARPKVHKNWGKAYFFLMLFLYLTGTYFTFTLHDWDSFNFARNLTFNFFGFCMVLYAYRAIRLFRQSGVDKPQLADYVFVSILTLSVILLSGVAVYRDPPLRVFSLLGIWLCVIEWKEVMQGDWSKPLFFKRHLRYIFASYAYALTVVSIVHLKDEIRSDRIRWLWPSLLGAFAIWLLTSERNSGRKAQTTRLVVWGTLSVAILFGAYVVFDLVNGPAIIGQN